MERERSPRRTEAQCPICLSDLSSEANIVLECRHAFHSTCLCLWFRRNPACPLCRSLPDESDEGSESENLGAAHHYSLLPIRSLTWAVSEPLRASRRRDAAPALRQAAAAFRRARGAVGVAARARREHRASEPFRTLMRELQGLVDVDLTRGGAQWGPAPLPSWRSGTHRTLLDLPGPQQAEGSRRYEFRGRTVSASFDHFRALWRPRKKALKLRRPRASRRELEARRSTK